MTQKPGKGLNPKLKKSFQTIGNTHKYRLKNNPQGLSLRIIHIFAIECHDIIKHTLGLDSRTVGVKLYSSYIAVNGFMPLTLLSVFVTSLIPLLSGSKL